MLYSRVLGAVALTACGFQHGKVGGSDASIVDGLLDDDAPVIDAVPADAPPDARACFGTFVTICLTAPPPADYTVATATVLDTNTGCTQVVAQTGGPPLCVIAAGAIHVDAELRASGPRPLVLLATSTLEISATGVVDVGSYRDEAFLGGVFVGAGAQTGPCGTPSAGGDDPSGGGGGGAGGSFGGLGGNGGIGRNSVGGANGQAASPASAPAFVRGGCRGSAGGGGNNTAGGGLGHGGGGVLLVAGASIDNAGHVRAGGQGGWGGAIGAGGGGGGSGGMIVLDATTITNTGILNANGGGGGEGGGTLDPGFNGASAYYGTAVSAGGTGNLNGGDGGAGSWATTQAGGAGGTDSNGAGGGAGGAGVIRVVPAQALGGTVSPPAS